MKRMTGLSLIEVMIATALMLLAVAAALSILARGQDTGRDVETRARLEETARAALDLLAHEVRMAGFLGRAEPGLPVEGASPVGAAPAPGLSAGGGCVASLALDLSAPVAGADGTFGAAPGVALGCRPAPSGRAVAGADTLIVRRASTAATRPDPGRLQLEATRGAARLLSDGSLHLGDDSRLHDLETSVFYVSADATGAAGQPALRRKRLVGGTAPAFQDEELITGVADLQVEFSPAYLPTPAGAETPYLPVDDFPAGAAVRSVRLWVLVQDDAAGGAARLLPALVYANRSMPAKMSRGSRLLVSRTVGLRNRGGLP